MEVMLENTVVDDRTVGGGGDGGDYMATNDGGYM